MLVITRGYMNHLWKPPVTSRLSRPGTEAATKSVSPEAARSGGSLVEMDEDIIIENRESYGISGE